MFEQTVQYEESLIWIKPVCEFFKINLQNQHRKLKKDPVLGNLWTKKSADIGVLDKNGRILLTKKGFLRWIMIINVNIIPSEMQNQFLSYQGMVSDFLFGSAEQEATIRSLVAEQHAIDNSLIELASKKRKVRKALNQALFARYQYSLDFNQKSVNA